MTTTEPRAQNPVGVTEQNEFRERGIAPAAERATWERSGADRIPALKPASSLDVADDLIAPFSVSQTIGADLGAGKGVTPAVRLLADDPARRRAMLTTFRGTICYIAAHPEAFEGFAARVKVDGTNAAPMPGMCAIEGFNGTELKTTRELWVMWSGTPAVNAWVSGWVERAARRAP